MIIKSLLGDSLRFSIGTFCFQGSRFVTQIYAARQLGPDDFGLWQGFVLIISYGLCANLGVLNAMNRDVPYYDGAGQTSKIIEVREISLGVAELVSLLLGLFVFSSSFFSPNLSIQIGLRYVAIMLVCQELYLFYQMLLKSHRMFRLMSMQQIAYSAFTLSLVLPLTHYFRFQGFLAGQVIVLVTTLLYIKWKVPFSITPYFDWEKARNLSKIGFPIMLAGLVFSLFTTLDRIMIIHYIGKDALGYYSLSIMVTGILSLIPGIVGQVVYPLMSRQYGKTREMHSLGPLIYKPTIFLMIIMVFILVGVYFLFPIFVKFFLVAYIPGIPSLKITIFGIFFLSLSGGFGNFLNTVGLQRHYLIIQCAAIAIALILNMISLRLGYGIEGIALATTLSYIFFSALLICSTHFLLKKEKTTV